MGTPGASRLPRLCRNPRRQDARKRLQYMVDTIHEGDARRQRRDGEELQFLLTKPVFVFDGSTPDCHRTSPTASECPGQDPQNRREIASQPPQGNEVERTGQGSLEAEAKE